MVKSRWILRRTRKLSDKFLGKIKMLILYSIFFFPKSHQLRDNLKKIWSNRTSHRWQYNTAFAFYLPDNYGYRYTLRICDFYWFPTATMVTRTRMQVALYAHCLSSYRQSRRRWVDTLKMEGVGVNSFFPGWGHGPIGGCFEHCKGNVILFLSVL